MRFPFLSLLFSLPLTAQIPSFPGAEGFGAFAAGGRGGDVYYVTNLNNNGAGSFREGLNTAPSTGRTVIFAVSGHIPVNSDTNFNVPSHVTIAGQTAPGDGISLTGGRMLISGDNVVVRHFRIRHRRNGTGGDCLNIASSAHTVMLDHISMMFSTDENFSFFGGNVNNFTMQNSSSAWGMERHNAGGLWDLNNGSCLRSLWAHHKTRNPKARPNGVLEWVNNVTFHWRSEPFIMGDSTTPANWKTNAIGNYYLSIDDPDDGYGIRSKAFSKARVASNGQPNFGLYLEDTYFDNNDNGIVDGTDLGYAIVSGTEFSPGDAEGENRYAKSNSPFPGAAGLATVTIDDAPTAYKKVISSVGPLRYDANHPAPLRDEPDALLIDSVVNQYSVLVQKDGKVSGEDPNRPNNGEQHLADAYGVSNGGIGTLNSTTPPIDEDRDGLPNIWEFSLDGRNGLSYPVTSSNNNTVFTSTQLASTFFPAGTPVGYTHLEEYLHFKAVPHAMMPHSTSSRPSTQLIDLHRYTDGFTASPTFTLHHLKGGTTEQFASDGITPDPDGPIVKFTPTNNSVGRAGFDFTVHDSQGSAWTQQFAILVTIEDPRLLNNGDFEGTDGSSSINGWSDSNPANPGFWLQDGAGGSVSDPSQPQGGSTYLSSNRLAGGASSQPASSTLSQTITLDGENLNLGQNGSALWTLNFYYQDGDSNDTGEVVTHFLNSSGSPIDSISCGVLPGNADWEKLELASAVPSGTTAIRIDITTNRIGGSATNVNFDSFSAQFEADLDRDGLPDSYEQLLIDDDPNDSVESLTDIAGPNDTFVTDFDNDGLNDNDEFVATTDPRMPDTDEDGYLDGIEVESGCSPLDQISLPPFAPVNGGFESPSTTSYLYTPADAGWTFTSAGVTTNNSGFTNGNSEAPEGTQVAFLQSEASCSQTLSGLTPGISYEVRFFCSQRQNKTGGQTGQTFDLTLDGVLLDSFSPSQANSGYELEKSNFTASAASHTIAFLGTNNHGGDNTVFIDRVLIFPRAELPPVTDEELEATRLTLSHIEGNQAALHLSVTDSVTGRTYQIEFSPSLSADSWLELGEAQIGTGNLLEVTRPITFSEDLGFFRVRLE
ncbi:hypothetical protein [Roseibacillus persicicus]|uniref:hypothetical protein n=1 Tax=Roseibacillus persicicus TaxID=454148 RepID=UPI00280D9C5B|nr:hypothetical protein [Roseibacillus persicicus]MDQ8188922.1 hypothetical protein [Roseibacillus persicicus]